MFRTSLLLVVAACLCVSCQPKKVRLYPDESVNLLKKGQLLLSDDFSKDLGNWQAEGSNWRIVDGMLYSGDKPNNNQGLWLKTPLLPDNYRIEFKARSVKGNNKDFQGDIKCEFGGTEPKHLSGYIMIFGGWTNSLNTLCRQEEHTARLVTDQKVKVEEGKLYTIQLIKSGKELSWYLDGKLFLSATDEEPIQGPNFGFNNWNSRFFIDDFKVFKL